MKPHHLLVGLLFAVNVLAAAALSSLAQMMQVTLPSDSRAIVFLGVALGQIGLAATWLAWGRLLVAIRGSLLLVVIIGWLFPLADNLKVRAGLGGILLLHAICVAAVLAIVRLTGATVSLDGELPVPSSRIKPWQFSVGGLLTLTTLLAMLLGVGRHVSLPWNNSLHACLFCLATAAASAVSIYAAFRLRFLGPALAVPPILCGFVGYNFGRLIVQDADLMGAFIGMGVLHGVVISLAAGVLRVAGYQLETKQVVNP